MKKARVTLSVCMREQLLSPVRGGESVSAACRRLRVPRQTVYGWRARDPEFAQALSDALGARRGARSAIAADKRIASSAVLRLTDFPAGWEESDKPPSTGHANCAGVAGAKGATTARDVSRTFTMGENEEAESAVYVYSDTATATRWFAQLTNSTTRICLGEEFGKHAARNAKTGVTIGQVSTGSLSIEPVGDERAAGRLTIPVTEGSTTVNVIADLIFVRVERGIAIVPLLGSPTPFDETLGPKLVHDVVNRLTTSLKQAP